MIQPSPMTRQRLVHAAALTLFAGIALRYSVNLTPTWWLVWIAPVPLLLLAFRESWRVANTGVFVAALIGNTVNLHYFSLVMPWPGVALVMLLLSLLWVFVVMISRRVVLRHRAAWTVLVYPALWTAVDTLLATFTPDGNWGSLAYSQSNVLPLVQITSLIGEPGLLFVLCLLPSTIAVAIFHRGQLRGMRSAIAVTALLLLGAFGYGAWRLATPMPIVAAPTRVGMASIDDPIWPKTAAADVEKIRAGYGALVDNLAAQGASVIVLPEKIAIVDANSAAQWKAHLGQLAARDKVWIDAGIGIIGGDKPRNFAWLFDPSGAAVEQYEKHFLAPPERAADYASSDVFTLHGIAGKSYGLAICKDMHFASLGRDYGARSAGAMLVPAWDFGYLDAWLETRTTSMRGVENGYAVIRASREGLLTASDAYGRVIAETRSAGFPGSSLIADVPIGAPIATLYTRIGNLFGWLCAGGVLVYFAWLSMARLRQGALPRKHPSAAASRTD